ncbi:50S ribosomal protein L18 [Gottschalkia acidurici 9a]|uniref:Large ribosomal subunit protein uL18 n=1 Tax=Gottschalkia acidurici (strain ATCC 7906 / DSM 604 / BCRC 14475 / CIP 104303 / KCTC 5404 / NCIMB 10678 / 9a) TaxID=1128398 RepID=K0B2T9_GOTA9|nr:50S ribosomal protein L18 [Gottschalkia acidurici]AFS79250.1 50S ribosomal protein L18 [Gottschalkia acidurici 9a]
MLKKVNSNKKRQKRQLRIRKTVSGAPERPRLNVYRSLNHIYAQVIDDVAGKTLVSASTLEKDLNLSSTGNKEAAKEVGKLVAKKALEKGIETVVFDRAGYLYHGRVKELAEGAREAGLKF